MTTPDKTTNNDATPASRLQHFPIPLFASVMGLGGLTLAWLKAGQVNPDLPQWVAASLRILSSALMLFLISVYTLKWLRYPQAVLQERDHPVRLNFFPAISIGILLLAAAWAHSAPAAVAFGLWLAGAALHLLFTLYVMSRWMFHPGYQINHISPAWFIPVVGNILVPVAGAQFLALDVSWFFFSIGLLFWLVLLTLVMFRLFFQEALPQRLLPTLFILIAPPAVGFLSYLKINGGEVDGFARILYFGALFFTLLLAANAKRFLQLPFFLSSWAYSFPLAAITIATLEMSQHSPLLCYRYLGWALFALANVVIATLVVLTLRLAWQGRLCQPE